MSAETRTLIHSIRAEYNLEAFDLDLLTLLEQLNNAIEEVQGKLLLLETELENTRKQASHASNIASCLANGIQPD